MSHLIQAQEKSQLQEIDLIRNGEVLVVAGSETTATLLSGATFYLLTNPRVLAILVNEIRSSFNSLEEITVTRVNQLDYMLAFLNEAFRLYPPGANAHPRVSP
jgi:cytochrome P450